MITLWPMAQRLVQNRARVRTPLRAMFENALDGMLLTAPDGRIFAANPAACRMLGRTEAEICAAGRAAVVVMDDRARAFTERRARDGSARGELTLKRADGTTFDALVASAVFEGDDGPRTTMSIVDLSERRRAQRALELVAEAGRVLGESLDIDATLQRLTSLLVPELADLCTVDIVEAGGVRRVAVAHRDPSRLEMTRNVRRKSAIARGGVDRVLETGQPELVPVFTDAYLRSATQDEEHFEMGRALGIRSAVIVPLVAHGRTIGAFTLASTGGVPAYDDRALELATAIAGRAALALDNARQHAAAVEATRLRDEVLGVVSHDLRNPLNVVSLYARSIAARDKSGDADAILRAVSRADRLIRDLLLASKMDFATIPLERRPESPAEILAEVALLNAAPAAAKSLELAADAPPDLPKISVDRHRVVQMLDNLVGNAIKFTEHGRVALRARVEGGALVVEVSDTGVGIAPAELPHVFDRFWQSAHAKRAGAGLGLAIARGVARAHGGDIVVTSEVGRGTKFVATLPGP